MSNPHPVRRRLALALLAAGVIVAAIVIGSLALFRRDLFPPSPTHTPTSTLTPTMTPSPTQTPTISPTASPSSPTPTVPAGVGRILYASERDGDFEIYMMDETGADLAKLTDNNADEYSPRFSPDGSLIAFVSNRGGDTEIYVMNADGTGRVQLTRNKVEDRSPAWSPDGTRLVFYSERDGNGELYVMSLDGDEGEVTRLTENGASDYYPAWQPGERVVFASNRFDPAQPAYHLYALDVTDAPGVPPEPLTWRAAVDWHPRWSPACGVTQPDQPCRLAWVSRDLGVVDGVFQVFVMGQDGSNVVQVTDVYAYHGYPVWSPDGNRVAFTSGRGGSNDIYVAQVDCPGDPAACEATVVQLTDYDGTELMGDWALLP